MKIGIIGWGSLIWSERTLEVENGAWRNDGPLLPIEFSRISTDNRLTLVIDPNFDGIPTYWKYSTLSTVEEACENLRIREDTPDPEDIGFLFTDTHKMQVRPTNAVVIDRLKRWGQEKKLDALIWTELEPKFEEKTNQEYTLDNIRDFIKGLKSEERARAEEYIRMAPEQTQTRWRASIYSMF